MARRTNHQRERDLKILAERYLKGDLQIDIAADLGVSQGTISNDLKEIHQRWLASSVVDYNDAKAKELARIDVLEMTYWGAWEESCKNAETTRQEGPKTGPEKIIKTSKAQAGDPRFLAGVQWCIDRRCKVLGIDAPQRIDHTTAGGPIPAPENVINFTGIEDEDLDAIITKLQSTD